MSQSVFWSAVWIGLSIAAPVGPIGVLVIQRTLRDGMVIGLATGLGAAAADAVYGAVGAYGVKALLVVLQGLRVPLVIGGGAFLLWLAWRTWRSSLHREQPVGSGAEGLGSLTRGEARQARARALASAFAGTFVLTLSNPATVLSFVAIFGALASRQQAVAAPGLMVAGVLLGSALWWLLLCAGVSRLRQRFDARAQRAVGLVSALMLAGFAVWQWVVLALEWSGMAAAPPG